MTALNIILLWYFELEHIKIKWRKMQLIGRFSFLKAAQIWSTRPMRYSPVQADQKKPNWAATECMWAILKKKNIYIYILHYI